MTQFTPGMEAELVKPSFLIFGAIKIEHPDGTIRLLDGASSLEVFPGETFVGLDPDWGVLAAIGEIDDGAGDEAPALSITMHPVSVAAQHALTDPAAQESRVRLWLGAVDAAGAVIADPLLLQDLVIDLATPTIGAQGKREVDIDCISGMEAFFENEEGFRLSDANHQRTWPGELGLSNMSGLVKKIYWGVAKPAGAAYSGNGGGTGFGSAGDGGYAYTGNWIIDASPGNMS